MRSVHICHDRAIHICDVRVVAQQIYMKAAACAGHAQE